MKEMTRVELEELGYKLYLMEDNTYHILYTKIDLVNVEIPAFVDGIPVTGIYRGGFTECHNLKTVVLPESINYIGYGAFQNCYSLKEINLGFNIEYIGNHAFSGCKMLEVSKLPKNLKKIEIGAFEWTEFINDDFVLFDLLENIPFDNNGLRIIGNTYLHDYHVINNRLDVPNSVNTIRYLSDRNTENLEIYLHKGIEVIGEIEIFKFEETKIFVETPEFKDTILEMAEMSYCEDELAKFNEIIIVDKSKFRKDED